MKTFLVLVATILLGVAIYTLVLGDDASSMKNKTGEKFEQQIELYKQTP